MLNKKCFSHQKQIEYLGIFLLVVNNLLTQTEWTKYHGNPVLGEWPNWTGKPGVIRDGDTLRMWITGGYPNASLDTLCQIGYAVSIDGINWDVYPDIILPVGNSGTWDSRGIETVQVLLDSTAPDSERIRCDIMDMIILVV